jgi:hypothetical protein
MMARMTRRQKKAGPVRKVTAKDNFHILFLADWTARLSDLFVLLDLGLGQLMGGLIKLKQVSAIPALGRKQAHFPAEGTSQ